MIKSEKQAVSNHTWLCKLSLIAYALSKALNVIECFLSTRGVIFRLLLKRLLCSVKKNGWMGNTERRCISSYKMLTQLETGRACLRWVLYHLVHWDRYNLKWRQIKSLEQSMHAKYLNFFLLIYDFFFYTFSLNPDICCLYSLRYIYIVGGVKR